MKKTMFPLATALTLLLAAPLAAQPLMGSHAKGGDSSADGRLERMSEQLDLSAEQQETIAALMAEQASKRDRMRTAFRTQVEAVLTEQQLAKRDAYRTERIERRVDRMSRRLDLSDDQQAELKTLLTEAQATRGSMRDGNMRERLASILSQDQLAKLARSGMGQHARF
ncbi:MAG: hypothetical protein ACLFTD_04630 [Halochromatium sp.]